MYYITTADSGTTNGTRSVMRRIDYYVAIGRLGNYEHWSCWSDENERFLISDGPGEPKKLRTFDVRNVIADWMSRALMHGQK